MGRIRRQRRYKAIDPFSDNSKGKARDGKKFGKKKKLMEYDLDPSPSDISLVKELPPDIPQFTTVSKKGRQNKSTSKEAESSPAQLRPKLRKSFNAKGFMEQKGKKRRRPSGLDEGPSVKKQKPDKVNVTSATSLHKRPEETRKQFFRRLDAQVGEALSKAQMDTKKLRKKRKRHLMERDQKVKLKKSKSHSDDEPKEFTTKDHIKFGEVVQQPPQLSSLPKKAKKKSKGDSRNLNLTKLLNPDTDIKTDERSYKDEDKPSLPTKKRRKDMTISEKVTFDKEREKVIELYRKLKNRPRFEIKLLENEII